MLEATMHTLASSISLIFSPLIQIPIEQDPFGLLAPLSHADHERSLLAPSIIALAL
jgi:hypothetical protein